MIRALALLLILTATAANATNDGFPALYDVTKVSSDDVLNIRSEPGAAGDVLGTLAADATDIEVIRLLDDGSWGMINFSEGTGWVSTAYLERHPDQLDYYYPEFASCGGTEPFWDMDRSNGAMTYAFMFDDTSPITEPILSEQTATGNLHRYSFRTENFIGLVARQYCDDGMSDFEFGLEINLYQLDRDLHLQGCCSLRRHAASD